MELNFCSNYRKTNKIIHIQNHENLVCFNSSSPQIHTIIHISHTNLERNFNLYLRDIQVNVVYL